MNTEVKRKTKRRRPKERRVYRLRLEWQRETKRDETGTFTKTTYSQRNVVRDRVRGFLDVRRNPEDTLEVRYWDRWD